MNLQQHENQWRYNESIIQWAKDNNFSYNDWLITITFYSALHKIDYCLHRTANLTDRQITLTRDPQGKHFEKKLRKKDTGFFAGIRKWNYQRQINKFENNEENPLHAGTKGENKVIDELLKLDEHYHILCGIRIELPYYVTYNGQKNLKSAQMDLVVVCPKGVFMIEVKNWSNSYAQNYDGLNPYEQTDRAGRVLWIALHDVIKNIRVKNIIL